MTANAVSMIANQQETEVQAPQKEQKSAESGFKKLLSGVRDREHKKLAAAKKTEETEPEEEVQTKSRDGTDTDGQTQKSGEELAAAAQAAETQSARDSKTARESEPAAGTPEIQAVGTAEDPAVPSEVWPERTGTAPKKEQGAAVPEAAEVPAASPEDRVKRIAFILEGKDGKGNKDVAAPQSGLMRTGSGETEEIMARMPQIRELTDERRAAAKDVAEKLRTYLCPLENEDDSGTAAKTGAPIPAAGSAKKTDGSQKTFIACESFESEKSAAETDTDITVTATGTMQTAGESTAVYTGGTQDASVKSAAAADAIERMIEAVRAGAENGEQHFTMQLKPEQLGRLSVTLTMGEHGLTARIRANDPEITQLLSAEIGKLVDSLGEKGIELKSVHVVYTGAESGNLSGQAYTGENRYGNGRFMMPAPQKKDSGTQTYEALQVVAAAGNTMASGMLDLRI